MRDKNGSPGDEREKEREFPEKRSVGFIQDLFEDLALALAQLFGCFEKGEDGEIGTVHRAAGLLILDHTGSGRKIVQRLIVRKGFEDFAPDAEVKTGDRDEVDQKERERYSQHEACLERSVDKKMFPSILGHISLYLKMDAFRIHR